MGEERRRFLSQAPLTEAFEWGGASFCCVHAAPSDPLYRYLGPDATEEAFEKEIGLVSCDFLLLGHTHRPLLRKIGETTVFNPGSVGQPSDGDPRASYGIWEDGHLEVKRAEYPIEETIRALEALHLSDEVLTPLARLLRTGESIGR
jgi:putative phosphoesterase